MVKLNSLGSGQKRLHREGTKRRHPGENRERGKGGLWNCDQLKRKMEPREDGEKQQSEKGVLDREVH